MRSDWKKIVIYTWLFALCPLLCFAQAQSLATDSIYNHEEKAVIYEKGKVVVSNGIRTFESKDEYYEMIFARSFHSHCGLFLFYHYWDAYQADTMLTEEEFFTVTGYLDIADKVRSYTSKKRFVKWSSPFLIIGGVLMAGISSDWGRESETNATTVVGLGISMTGIIFGAETLSKSKKKKFEIEYAINAMDNYNKSLREKLGLTDSIKVKDDLIETTVKTLGIEVVPYNTLDEKPEQLNNPQMPFPGLRFLPLEMVIQVLIDTTGTIVACQMSETSGINAFDAIVLDAFQKTKFTPPKQYGQKVYTIMARPLKFGVR